MPIIKKNIYNYFNKYNKSPKFINILYISKEIIVDINNLIII